MAALFLAGGCLIVVLILLEQNAFSAYSMSTFEIVRFSLLTFLPLIALIVGNRLIVNEYLNGTWLFVEALPVGGFVPMLLKYVMGFVYIAIIATTMVLLAGTRAGIADDVTSDYMLLILVKTWVMVSLYWSVVFCFSLCGYLRIALYLLTAALIAILVYYPGLDGTSFPPIALMDSQFFVYERDVVPLPDMAWTLVLSAIFTLAGFLLIRLGEGSVIERLAKPMTRRDYVALGVLAASGLAVASALIEQNQRDPINFSNTHVVNLQDPDVSVLYLSEEYKESAMDRAGTISELLSGLQATLALPSLPTVRLALSPGREKHDIDYSTVDGVFITANWLEHDSYDNAVLDTVILHGLLSAQTNGRGVFEPYHWVLDGFTRWWVEQGDGELDSDHRDELIARALLALEREPQAFRLITRWQLTADKFSYPSAEALAWAAMNYLEQSQGRDVVVRLASEFLTQPLGSSLLAAMRDTSSDVQSRVESIIGMSLEQFHVGWQQWLFDQEQSDGVQQLLAEVPALVGTITSSTSTAGVRALQASYQVDEQLSGRADQLNLLSGVCVMKHERIGPFDGEFDVLDDDENRADCRKNVVAHSISSRYTSGDRVFVALDYESEQFHQPVRLHAQRVYVP